MESFDVEAIRAEYERLGSKRVKRGCIKNGHFYMLSLYGASYNKETDQFSARRIEILSDKAWDKEAIKIVYTIFDTLFPPYTYSLWEYTDETEKLRLMGGYN